MKKINIIKGMIIFITMIIFSACSDMNELHDVYLRDGEITYVGRVDSIRSFSGHERVLIQYWITDPRVKKLHIFWNQKRDSVVVSVPPHDPIDSLEVLIGNGNGEITEGDHTFFFYSYDDKGHRSVVFESLINVFGDRYQTSLINRPIKNVNLNTENGLIIIWGGSINTDEIGVKVSYFDINSNLKDLFISSDSLKNPIVFNDIDVTKSITYKTAYLPSEFAIDTFYTDVAEPIKVLKTTNVALHKNTTVSDMLNSNFPGANAVDGIVSSASRWVSTSSGEHWIEVDLEKPYPIQSFKTYNGSGNTPNMAIANFMFQAYLNGSWVTLTNVTNNTNHSYGATFNEVTADKVRLFIPNYPDNTVRLFELEVYSTISLN